jgi:chromosome segregation ATPase
MTKPRVVPLWLALALAALCSVVFAIVIYGLVRTPTGQGSRLSQLEAENRDLRTHSDNLARETDALRQRLAAQPGEPAPEVARSEKAAPGVSLEQAKMLIQFREQLAAANKSIEGLQVRIQELQYTIEKTTDENKRLSASEADLKEKVAASTRVLDAVQAEMKGKEERLADLESANRRLREDNRASADKIAQIPRYLRELEEINRRREGYLSGILRRYRDITDQYRSLAARLDRDNAAPGASELGAIQNTISMTEEDLRQLASLNSQAARVQQKIAGK